MSDPTIMPLGCATTNITHDINEAVRLRPDASANRDGVEEDHTLHHAHLGVEVFDLVAIAVELSVHSGAGVIAGAASALSGIPAYVLLINHAHQERDRQNLEINDDMARGALAAFEGRMDDPEVRAEARENTAFADGMMRVERFFYTNPHEFRALAMEVRASSRGGMLAVARGEQETEAFQKRMEIDPAFAHGAGYMARLRESDPDAFEAKAAWLEGLASDVEAARHCEIRG